MTLPPLPRSGWPRRALSLLRHRSNRIVLALALLLGMVFVASTVYLARVQTLDEYRGIAVQMADYAVQRTDRIREYTVNAEETLRAAGAADPCSESNLALMRRLSYASDLIVDVGYVQDDRLLCSISGRHGDGIPVGRPDYRSPTGADLRLGVRLPFARDALYTMSTVGGYTSIMRADWSEDVLGWMPGAGIAIGALHPGTGKLLFARGQIDPALLEALAEPVPKIDESKYLVALKGSPYRYAGFAIIPTHELESHWRARALEMLPMGLLISLLLTALVSWVTWRQASMPAMIRVALRQNEFHMVYQPVVELASGRWVGMEALIRWRKPGGAMVPPDVFIPVAERHGLIGAVTDWVVRRVLSDTRDLLQQHPGFHVAVNVAGDDLLEGRLQQELDTLLAQDGIAPAQLICEITERVFMDAERTGEQVRELRALGMKIAIDDFGTGYSSLSYLTRLELDYLKIDKAFVSPIGTGAVTASVVSHIIALAHSLQLQMVAEGVETQAQADYLREQGVHYAQGWLFARPMHIRDVRRQMAANG